MLGPALAVTAITLVASSFVALASLVVRARGADADTRQQIRWLQAVGVLGGVLFVTLLALGFVFGVDETGFGASAADVLMVLLVVTIVVGIPAATAVALFRYRLYDLNLVVRRAVVVAVMATTITVAYVAIVIAVPALIRGAGGGGASIRCRSWRPPWWPWPSTPCGVPRGASPIGSSTATGRPRTRC